MKNSPAIMVATMRKSRLRPERRRKGEGSRSNSDRAVLEGLVQCDRHDETDVCGLDLFADGDVAERNRSGIEL